eukprot:2918748-Rhodomonas_salina.4
MDGAQVEKRSEIRTEAAHRTTLCAGFDLCRYPSERVRAGRERRPDVTAWPSALDVGQRQIGDSSFIQLDVSRLRLRSRKHSIRKMNLTSQTSHAFPFMIPLHRTMSPSDTMLVPALGYAAKSNTKTPHLDQCNLDQEGACKGAEATMGEDAAEKRVVVAPFPSCSSSATMQSETEAHLKYAEIFVACHGNTLCSCCQTWQVFLCNIRC